jgi:hypothetical protein
MRERTARLIESLLILLVRALLPARGRHRATTPAQLAPAAAPVPASPARRSVDVWPFEPDTHFVRPYLPAPDEMAVSA